jgi:hypothetical protein
VRANPANKNLSLGKAEPGAVEIWHLKTGGGWSHPVHVHFEEGKILSRDGEKPPSWEKWGRKDVYRIGRMPDSGHEVEFAIRFREFGGTYMEHCHNTQHEDTAMLLRWDIDNPGELIPLPTPHVGWDGTTYEDSFALENGTWKKGDTEAAGDYASQGGGSTDDGWCDVDWNGQVDHRDIGLISTLVTSSGKGSVVLTSSKGEESEFTPLDAEACELECKYDLCMVQEPKCGLVGLEGIMLLIPLGLGGWRKRPSRVRWAGGSAGRVRALALGGEPGDG